MAQTYSLAIHGGAGTLIKGLMTPELEANYRKDLKKALEIGYMTLDKGGSAIEAVEKAVVALENSSLFNAGKGSVFTSAGSHEMDACIMDGSNLKAGAVSLVSGVKNPIKLSREIMDKSEHVFLAGPGAEEFARSVGLEFPKFHNHHQKLGDT